MVVIHTEPHPKHRKQLFSSRQKITNETGWYPYVQGAVAHSNEVPFQTNTSMYQSKQKNTTRFTLGDLVRIRRVSDVKGFENNYNAFLVEESSGNLLLDTGFGVDLHQLSNLSAIFISHMHSDHTKGLGSLLLSYQVPIILSDTSARHILSVGLDSEENKQIFMARAMIIDRGPKPETDVKLDVFPVFHTPGSYGLVISDHKGKAIFYPGDFCLRNGFYDGEYNRLLERILEYDAKDKYVFIDAALARGKDFPAIDEGDIPESIINEFAFATQRDVFFLAKVQELSFYTYLYAWNKTQKLDPENQPIFVISDYLFDILGSLYYYMKAGEREYLDPFVKKLWPSGGIANFAESYRVYPLSSLHNFEVDEKFIFFISDTDLKTNTLLQNRLKWSNVIRLAKLASVTDQEMAVICEPARNILKVAAPDWSFHSREKDLVEFIHTLTNAGVKVILFHQGKTNLEAFIRRYGFKNEKVFAISERPIELV